MSNIFQVATGWPWSYFKIQFWFPNIRSSISVLDFKLAVCFLLFIFLTYTFLFSLLSRFHIYLILILAPNLLCCPHTCSYRGVYQRSKTEWSVCGNAMLFMELNVVLPAFTITENHLILVSQSLAFPCTLTLLIPEQKPTLRKCLAAQEPLMGDKCACDVRNGTW